MYLKFYSLLKIDAEFTIENIMDTMKDLKAWESFYFTVTGNRIYVDFPNFKDTPGDRRKSINTFMRDRPGKISWVNLAEAAYLCGEEQIFDQLSEKMKSPEGVIICIKQPSMCMHRQL